MSGVTRLGVLIVLISLISLPGQGVQAHLSTTAKLIQSSLVASLSSASFPPATIRVRITGKWQCDLSAPYTVQTISFNEYVKNVLPNEWDGNWPYEAYKAGAVAVKMFAWYWIAQGGKWPDADVYDSICDQVYKPGTAYGLTNRAVDETWFWTLSAQDGQPFQPYHKYSLFQCGPPLCMSQMGSRDLALEGYTWDEILQNYYPDAKLTSLRHTPAGYALSIDADPATPGFRLPLPMQAFTTLDYRIEGWLKVPLQNKTPGLPPCSSWYQNSLSNTQTESGSSFLLSVRGGELAFVARNPPAEAALCSQAWIADGGWHQFAIESAPSTKSSRFYLDGLLVGQLRIASVQPSFLEFAFPGLIDEVQITDLNTSQPLAVYHLDEGIGDTTVETIGGQPVMLDQESMVGSIHFVESDLFQHNLYFPFILK